MKKLVSVLVALLLCLTLTCSAVAETSYTTLQMLLADPSAEHFYLGEAKYTAYEASEGVTMFVYFATDGQAMLLGWNDKGESEVTIWDKVEIGTALMSLYGLCANWETIEGYAEDGTSIALGIHFGDEQMTAWIDSAESAASFCENIRTYLEETAAAKDNTAGTTEEAAQ